MKITLKILALSLLASAPCLFTSCSSSHSNRENSLKAVASNTNSLAVAAPSPKGLAPAPAPAPRMTAKEIIAVAAPVLPLHANEKYDVRSEKDGTWEVVASPTDGARVWRYVKIRDADGEVLEKGNKF